MSTLGVWRCGARCWISVASELRGDVEDAERGLEVSGLFLKGKSGVRRGGLVGSLWGEQGIESVGVYFLLVCE